MTTETILTDDLSLIKQLREYAADNGYSHNDYADTMTAAADALEQAALQSPEVQALRKDAELFQFILEEAWFQRAFDRFDPDDNGDQSKFESECRRILIAIKEQQE